MFLFYFHFFETTLISEYFSQVNINKNNKLRCTSLQKLDLDYSLLTCNWLNTRTIAALDTKEQLHLVDVRTKQELEKLDLSSVRLVYNSSHFKGLSTGGNVSKALVIYQSVVKFITFEASCNFNYFLGVSWRKGMLQYSAKLRKPSPIPRLEIMPRRQYT